MQIRKNKFDTRMITLTASLTALYIIPRTLPLDRLIGAPGSITFSGIVTPVLGFFLAPSYGILAVFLGTMIAAFIPGSAGVLKFGGLDFLGGALNVALVSLLVRGRRNEAVLAYVATLGLFIINPNTEIFVGSNFPKLSAPFQWLTIPSPPVPFLWLHLIALVVLVSPLTKNLGSAFSVGARRTLTKAILVTAFIGTMLEHAAGGILFASLFGPAVAFRSWPLIFLLYPFERTVIVIGAVLVCVPLLIASRNLTARLQSQEV